MLLAVVFALLSVLSAAAGNFFEGEVVSTARRGQYHGTRTVWHDLLGRHCPKFGRDTKVAVPIPQPKGFKAIDQSYKIQLAFDGDRIIAPWVPIIGKGRPKAPILHVELEHRDNVLIAARTELKPVSLDYLKEHQVLLLEFQNATHWPKHLLVQYSWKHTNPINATAGLYLIFISGVFVTFVLAISVLVSYQEKLQAFLADLAADQSQLDSLPAEKAD